MNDIGRTTPRLELASRPERVTFFEDRAEVLRKARAEIPAGVSVASITGVSLLVDDSSVVARVNGEGARVLSSRVVRQVRQVPEHSDDEIKAMEGDHESAKARRQGATRAAGRAAEQQLRAAALTSAWAKAVARGPSAPASAGRRRSADVGREWRTAFDEIDAAMSAALDQISSANIELTGAVLDEERARLRLEQGRALHPRYETKVEVQLDSAAGGEIEIELIYRTPCALWRPEHLARLTPRADGKGYGLQIRTFATVWQRTGEDWSNVLCRFSTARPAQAASPPLLTDDVLRSRKKTEQEVVVEARDQAVSVAGLDRGVRAVEEMPGVEDGGEPLWFEAASPTKIASDGAPFRIEIAESAMPCEVDRIAYPERSESVYVRATATLSSKTPLLAGPVWVGRNSGLVGRAKVGFVAKGEPFELGFGVDDGLRVRRRVDEKRESTAITGAQKVTRSVHVYVSNLSAETRRLTVTERFPVSEIGDVEVSLIKREGAVIDTNDGFAKFDLELAPRATREVVLGYRIEAASKVVLPF